MELDYSGWPVPVFCNYDFRPAFGSFHRTLPLAPSRKIERTWLLSFKVIRGTVHEHHDVGVLFDCAAVSQVSKVRPLVIARLGRPVQLRQREHRDAELF